MRTLNFRAAALALVAGLGLSGCAYGPYGGLGVGVGTGYGNYGYNPYYSNGYGYYGSGYSPYGYAGYGSPYYGWYDGFYYPGTGYYVYDQYRNPYRWSDAQQRYWEQRRPRSSRGDSSVNQVLQNWADFNNRPQGSTSVIREQSVTAPQRVFRSRDVSRQRTSSAQTGAQIEAQQQARVERRQQTRVDRQQVREQRMLARSQGQQQARSERSFTREQRSQARDDVGTSRGRRGENRSDD